MADCLFSPRKLVRFSPVLMVGWTALLVSADQPPRADHRPRPAARPSGPIPALPPSPSPSPRGEGPADPATEPGWIFTRGGSVLYGRVEVTPTAYELTRGDQPDSRGQLRLPRSAAEWFTRDADAAAAKLWRRTDPKTPADYSHLIKELGRLGLQPHAGVAKAEAEQKFPGESFRRSNRGVVRLASHETPVTPQSTESIKSTAASPPRHPTASRSKDAGTAPLPTDHADVYRRSIAPMLRQACGRCHDGRNGTDDWFTHARSVGGPFPSAYLDLVQSLGADASRPDRFFEMATQAHGPLRRPPLSPRHRDARRTLWAWLNEVNEVDSDFHRFDTDPPPGGRSEPVGRRLPAVIDPTDPAIFNAETEAKRRWRQSR